MTLFSVAPDCAVDLLARAVRASPGVQASAEPVRPSARVVALGTLAPIDEAMVAEWLSDHARAGWPAAVDPGPVRNAVHVAEIEFRRRLIPGILHLVEGELPAPSAQITRLLETASAEGKAGRNAAAAVGYRKALDVAATRENATGEIKARIGLSLALRELGYVEDAVRLLQDAVAAFEFDRKVGSQLARAMARHELSDGMVSAAERWLAEAKRIEGGASVWLALLEAEIAFAQRDPARAAAALSEVGNSAPTDTLTEMLRLARAQACAGLGNVADAQALLAAPPSSSPEQLEVVLQRAHAEVALTRAQGREVPWRRTARVLSVAADARGDGRVSHMEAHLLTELVDLALDAGEVRAGHDLLATRFFAGARACNAQTTRLCVASRETHTLVGHGGGVRRLGVGRGQLRTLIQEAREAVLRAEWSNAQLAAVRELLLPERQTRRLCVAHDGVLADLPLTALAGGIDGPLPQAWEVVPGAGCAEPCASHLVASLADPEGDLPGAHREVTAEQAAVFVRGEGMTRRALANLGNAGLLHVGTHLRRERSGPELLLADGPVSPQEIEGMALVGHPLVVLSGCDSGVRGTERGVEWSFASAFLRAGASGVVATRWPVRDGEYHRFVQLLLLCWPFSDPALVIAMICARLRHEGAPSRLWAAPVLYAPP
ncbi:MAG: CHAT domain-containing protein [Myxococcota bacterium]